MGRLAQTLGRIELAAVVCQRLALAMTKINLHPNGVDNRLESATVHSLDQPE